MKSTFSSPQNGSSKSKELSKKIDTLIKLSQNYERTKPKHSFRMAYSAYSMAKKLEYEYGIAFSLCMMGRSSWVLGEFDDAISYLIEAIEVSKRISVRQIETSSLITLGNICYDSNDFDKALEYYMSSLKIAEENGFIVEKANALNNIGEIYRNFGAYEDALNYYLDSKAIHDEIGTVLERAIPILNIGDTYFGLKDFEKAKEFNLLALKVSQEAGDRLTESYSYYQLATTHYHLKEYETAKGYYFKGLHIAEEMGDRVNLVHMLTDMGLLYETQGSDDEAVECYKRAHRISQELKINALISKTCSRLASIHEKREEFSISINYYKELYEAERKETASKLEQNLRNVKAMFKMDQVQKEKEIYQLKNVELKQKSELLAREIEERKRIQKELEQANRKLSNLSRIDDLTGIPNRRRFQEVIRAEWARAKREANPLSLMFIDIDYFKEYNDNFGHLAGDKCIKKVARLLNSAVRRASDFVGRYGGDEFVAVLPNTGLKGACKLAEKMRTKVEDLQICSCSGNISVTLGIACVVPGESVSLEEFIKAADKALYHAKGSGRNRIKAVKLKE